VALQRGNVTPKRLSPPLPLLGSLSQGVGLDWTLEARGTRKNALFVTSGLDRKPVTILAMFGVTSPWQVRPRHGHHQRSDLQEICSSYSAK